MPAQPDEQDTATRCTHCHRPLYDTEIGRWACRPCEDRAAKQLRELPDLYRQLGDILAPGSAAPDNGGKVSVSRAAPLPVNVHILNLCGPGGVVTELVAVEDSWRAALQWTATPFRGNYQQTIRGAVTFLTNNLGWACEAYESVPFDLDVIQRLHGQCKAATTGERRRRIAVTCLAEYDDGTVCGAELRIDICATATRCQSCGASWGREDWLRLHEAVRKSAA